ncbi:MAG: hypothetical protein ACJAQ6_002302 [Arenicella sp.]|jgi:hypothetical protein
MAVLALTGSDLEIDAFGAVAAQAPSNNGSRSELRIKEFFVIIDFVIIY